jgi:hypothetical protein
MIPRMNDCQNPDCKHQGKIITRELTRFRRLNMCEFCLCGTDEQNVQDIRNRPPGYVGPMGDAAVFEDMDFRFTKDEMRRMRTATPENKTRILNGPQRRFKKNKNKS